MTAIEATLAWFPRGRGIVRGDEYNRAAFRDIQHRLSDVRPYITTVETAE